MLEKITLQNFQKHRKLTVKFDPGVTTIVGQTDRGKSAVIRAMQWLATNRPAGGAFVRKHKGTARVALVVDGRRVTRSKGKRTNTYHLDGRVLRAFKSAVPDDVAKLLRIGQANTQGQHDPPFWFSNSAGEVSRNLNKIVNLEKIDGTLGYLSRTTRVAKVAVGVCRERLKTTKRAARTLRPAVGAAKAWARLMAAGSRMGRTAILRGDLGAGVAEGGQLAQTAQNAANVAARGMVVTKAGAAWLATRERYAALAWTVDQIQSHAATAGWVAPDLKPLTRVVDDLKKQKARIGSLQILMIQLDGAIMDHDRAAIVAITKRGIFNQVMGDTCPLCGAKQ